MEAIDTSLGSCNFSGFLWTLEENGSKLPNITRKHQHASAGYASNVCWSIQFSRFLEWIWVDVRAYLSKYFRNFWYLPPFTSLDGGYKHIFSEMNIIVLRELLAWSCSEVCNVMLTLWGPQAIPSNLCCFGSNLWYFKLTIHSYTVEWPVHTSIHFLEIYVDPSGDLC